MKFQQLLHYLQLFRSQEAATLMRLRRRGIVNRRFYLYKRAVVEADATASIHIGKGDFYFNRAWIAHDPFPSLLFLGAGARLETSGEFSIYSGSKVYVNKGAVLSLGSGYCNSNLNISCFERVEIGREVAISEGVTIRDSDDHTLTSGTHTRTRPIRIGNRVWIGMNATILKGVQIGDGAIVAAGAVVTRNVPPQTLVGGVPARVLRENVSWKL